MRTFALALTICALFAPGPAAAEARTAQRPSLKPRSTTAALRNFDSFVSETLRTWNVPGVALSVVKDGKVVLSKGYGVRDPANGKPMTKDTIFRIASVTKTFTGFGAGLLVDEGKLRFDTPVSTYLPGLALKDPAASSELTLSDMLSHRSGVPRHDAIWYHNSSLTREQLPGRYRHLQPSAPLRTKWQYSNMMFSLAGLVVDRLAGSSYESFLEQRVFQPLGMTRTGFSPEGAEAEEDYAGGAAASNGKLVNIPMERTSGPLNPAGGIYSTADDLTRWMIVNLAGGRFEGKQIIQPATLTQIHSTHIPMGTPPKDPELIPIGYGLGWYTDLYRERQMLSHYGNIPGISTMLTLVPQHRLGITVLVNHGASELVDVLTRDLMDRFIGAPSKDWAGEALARKVAGELAGAAARQGREASRVSNTRPSHALADYVGTYFDPGYGELTIGRQGNELTARLNDDTAPLSHWHYDVFEGSPGGGANLWSDRRVQFITDVFGHVTAAEIFFERSTGPVRFIRQVDKKMLDPAYLRRLTGTYEMAGNRFTLTLSGTTLIYTPFGTYFPLGYMPAELEPALNGEFVHSLRRNGRISFQTGPSQEILGLSFSDPSGTYHAKRID